MARLRSRPHHRGELILRDLAPLPRPSGAAIFLLAGLPGSGKSTFARALASLTGAVVLESDRFRRLLFETPVHSQRESAVLFRALVAAARHLVRKGHAVVVDATNVSEADRRAFYTMADELEAPLVIAALEAPFEVIEGRLRARAHASDGYLFADLAVYHRMRGRVEPISRPHRRIETSDASAVEAGLSALASSYRDVGKGVTAQ